MEGWNGKDKENESESASGDGNGMDGTEVVEFFLSL